MGLFDRIVKWVRGLFERSRSPPPPPPPSPPKKEKKEEKKKEPEKREPKTTKSTKYQRQKKPQKPSKERERKERKERKRERRAKQALRREKRRKSPLKTKKGHIDRRKLQKGKMMEREYAFTYLFVCEVEPDSPKAKKLGRRWVREHYFVASCDNPHNADECAIHQHADAFPDHIVIDLFYVKGKKMEVKI